MTDWKIEALKLVFGFLVLVMPNVAIFVATLFKARADEIKRKSVAEAESAKVEVERVRLAAETEKLAADLKFKTQEEQLQAARAAREMALSATKRADHMQDQFTDLTNKFAVAQATVATLQGAVKKLESELDTRKREASARTTQLEGMTTRLNDLQGRVNMLEIERLELLDANAAKEKEIEKRDATIAELNKQLRIMREEITTLNDRIAAMERPADTKTATGEHGAIKLPDGTVVPKIDTSAAPPDAAAPTGGSVPDAA